MGNERTCWMKPFLGGQCYSKLVALAGERADTNDRTREMFHRGHLVHSKREMRHENRV